MAKQTAKRFTDLIVWQKAHKFVLAVYRFTVGFPKEEVYGLTSQIRRAAISIAANIVEGFKKTGSADKIRFLNISQGSLEECRYYLILAKDLGYGHTDVFEKQIDEVAKLLAAYSNAVKRNN
jgi:four helix bundle protein